MLLRVPPRKSILAFVLVKAITAVTSPVPVLPVDRQTRAPTGKLRGPSAGRLLSSPITSQVIGVTVRVACAVELSAAPNNSMAIGRKRG